MHQRRAPLSLTLLILACSPAWGTPEFDRFQALIGLDDGCKGRSGDAIFRIDVDGKEVLKSDVLLPGQTPIPVDVSIAGAKELILYIDDEGDGHGGDWGDWLDAKLVNTKTGEFMFLTDLVPEEKFWIPSNRDRNIIQNKLSVDGKTYLRGWGGISGDTMVFKNWEAIAAEKEAAVDRANADAARDVGTLTLKVSVAPPPGLGIALDGKPLSLDDLRAGVALGPTSILNITANPADPAQVDWWRMDSPAHVIAADGRAIPFVHLIQPDDRVLHKTLSPNQNVLRGAAPDETQGYWNGQPDPPTGETSFDLGDLPLRFERAYRAAAAGAGALVVRVQPYKTTEVPSPASITSARLTVAVDDKPIAYMFSDSPDSWNQAVPLAGWPDKLECITTPGGDGSLGDGFVVDLGVQLPGMDNPLWLHSIQPSYSRFDYREPKRLLVSGAWELPGSGIARWNDLSKELDARRAGEAELAKAKDAVAAAKDAAEVDAAVDTVLALDPKQTEIRIAAAARCRELGNLEQERKHWGLLVEESRADLRLIQQAKVRIDEIWDEIDPAPWVYPDDGSPTRTARALGRRWTGSGEFTNRIWTITFDSALVLGLDGDSAGDDGGWTVGLSFQLPTAGRYGIMVNSLGIEVTAKLEAAGKAIAEKTAKHPFFDVDLAQAGVAANDPLTLLVTIEPDVTGINLTHTMEVACWPVSSGADLPTEEWDLHLNPDGSAEVSRTSRAPILAAIPRTAMNLTVEGAEYTIQEPITEYLVDWDDRLGSTCLPFFAVPAAGQEVKVTYHWPDAAYNVPMSRYGWDRLERVYLKTPSGILDTRKMSVWRITHIPEGWVNKRYTPEPTAEGSNTFEVDPKSALGAEWEARDAQTAWTAMSHDRLRMFVPDNPNNRRWFPVWMKYVRMVYDKEKEITGHERPALLYVGVQGASQLSGYGGGTLGDEYSSETWIASTGRMAPCFWRHAGRPSLVDAHELHWVFLACRVPGAPTWTDAGFASWIEESGWRCTDLADCRFAWRVHMNCLGPAIELIKKLGYNPMQLEGDAFEALPADQHLMMVALGWYISEQLYEKYGADFWARFWREQYKLYHDVYPILSDRAKQILLVDELVRVSGDPDLRRRFTDEWLFDLTPNPEDKPDRFLILPRQPKITDQDKPEFASPDFADYGWYTVSAPLPWQAGGHGAGESPGPGPWKEKVIELGDHRGVVWYRFTFDVPADFECENLDLVMGPIEMADETYVNGTKVGATGKFPPDQSPASDVQRVYRLPDGLVKPGERCVVAVRVFDENGVGIKERPRLISRVKPPK
jgi:hypothetical protein